MAMARSFNLLVPVLLTFTCFFCLLYFYYVISSSSQPSFDGFHQCRSDNRVPVFMQSSYLFMPLLSASISNPKFLVNTTVRPLYIVMPTNTPHVQAAVRCGSGNNMSIRVRTGGHDYEGLSYRSVNDSDFAVLDLSKLRNVSIDTQAKTAWVDSDAALGELFYNIGNASNVLGFPAGVCPTIGIGGHFSGGGFGMMMCKYVWAVHRQHHRCRTGGCQGQAPKQNHHGRGRLLGHPGRRRRELWHRCQLAGEPRARPSDGNGVRHLSARRSGRGGRVTKWQEVAPTLAHDLVIRVLIKNKRANFQALFLGRCEALLPSMNNNFSELRFNRSDCREMTWLQSAPYIYHGNGSSVEDLLKQTTSPFFSSHGFKATTDYVRQEKPIPRDVWAGIFHKFAQPGARDAHVFLDPYSGYMIDVPELATPFPHRTGVLYSIQFYNY